MLRKRDLRYSESPPVTWTGPEQLHARRPTKSRFKHPTSQFLWKAFVRIVPILWIIVMTLIVRERVSAWQEGRLWRECQAVYDSGNAAKLATLETFLRKYPDNEHFDDVNYYYAQLGHATKGCEAVEEAWRRVLRAGNAERSLEATMRLGECAAKAGNHAAAIGYYTPILNAFPRTRWTPLAALAAGSIAEETKRQSDAVRYYTLALEPPATPQEARDAATRIGKINFSHVFNTSRTTHQVRRNEILMTIAAQYGVSTASLMASNPWLRKPSQLQIGDRVVIPPKQFSVVVSLDDRLLYVLYRGKVIKPFPVAVGTDATKTPTGAFILTRKEKNPTQIPTGGSPVASNDVRKIVGTRWLEFDLRGYGIQGGGSLDTLASASTNGTIQMTNEDIEEVYELLPMDAPIRIEKKPKSLEWYDPT